MAARWSNPSGGLGTDRFKVWPAGTDSYSHTDLTTNFDEADAIIGIPSSGTWPPSTGVDGGIYKEVRLLQLERMPIGSVTAFFKPTDSYVLPTGWAVADGSTIAASNHDFTGISTSVTLPDLRHAFILGADPTKTIGTAAAAVNTANIDSVTGAPGPQATGGSNQHTLLDAEMPSHAHGGGAHSHTTEPHSHGIADPGHKHPMHDFAFGEESGDAGGTGTGSFTGTATTGIAINPTTVIVDASGSIVTSEGSDNPHENRPRWVGLIYIVKIKYADTV